MIGIISCHHQLPHARCRKGRKGLPFRRVLATGGPMKWRQ